MLVVRVLVTLLLALTASCIPYRPTPLMVEDRPVRACTLPIQLVPITVADEPAIPLEAAIDFWNRNLGHKVFTLEWAQTKVYVVWAEEFDSPRYLGQARIPQSGVCWEVAGVFLKLDHKMLFSRLYSIIVHELGHILGLSHHPSPEYIMYRTIPKDPPKRAVSPTELYLIRRLLPMEL